MFIQKVYFPDSNVTLRGISDCLPFVQFACVTNTVFITSDVHLCFTKSFDSLSVILQLDGNITAKAKASDFRGKLQFSGDIDVSLAKSISSPHEVLGITGAVVSSSHVTDTERRLDSIGDILIGDTRTLEDLYYLGS